MTMRIFILFLPFITKYNSSELYELNSKEEEVYNQRIDDFSINLRDYTDLTNFYNNFVRKGETVAFKNYIRLVPKMNNTLGLFYTSHVR